MTDETKRAEAGWYVVHTYSGYENKVKVDLEKTITNRQLQDQILEVLVPMEDVVEVRNDVKRVVQRKTYPGYVIIHMFMNEDLWFIVRNTRGVTGFVGADSKEPMPLSQEEIDNLGILKTENRVEFSVGDAVTVVSGVWEGTAGVVKSVNQSKQTLTLNVEMFGSETPVEMAFSEVKHM